MEAYMRKALMCLLALTLILFTFIACDDNTSLPNTPKEKEATIDQKFLFQQLYRQSFLNQNEETTGVTLANGAYTFTDVEIDDSVHDLEGTLNGTFKDTETEISINVSFTDKDKKTSTVSGTIKRNGKEAVITINGEKCLIDNHQVPPYRDKTQPIPQATTEQSKIFYEIFTNAGQINTSKPEGFTKVEEDSFLYENVKILDGNGNVEGILNGKMLGGAYCNVTYKGADGVIKTGISFFDKPSPDTNIYIFIINGEACKIILPE